MVNGRRFTDLATNNSIFLPAAGMLNAFDKGTLAPNVGKSGLYWSSTVSPKNYYRAYELVFDNEVVYCDEGGRRAEGYPVRPVAK